MLNKSPIWCIGQAQYFKWCSVVKFLNVCRVSEDNTPARETSYEKRSEFSSDDSLETAFSIPTASEPRTPEAPRVETPKAIQPRTAHAHIQNLVSEVRSQSHDQSSASERQRLLEPNRNAAEDMPREVRSQVVDSRASEQTEQTQVSNLFFLTSPFFLGESIIVWLHGLF